MLMLSDEYHTVTNSIVSGRERKRSLSNCLCFCERYAELRFWCQKLSELVWMDGRQEFRKTDWVTSSVSDFYIKESSSN